jgi:hypothetical protein
LTKKFFDLVSGDVTHTIGQIPVYNGDGKHWLLRHGRFRLYGLSESTMAAFTELATPLRSPSCTNHTPLSSRVKVEPSVESITILNDDSDVSSPQDAMPTKCCSWNLPSQDVPYESPDCTSRSVLQPGLQLQSSVVDCLKRLCATKDFRNALKKIDYDNIKHLKVDYLPPVFNGDVVFEFPSILSSFTSPHAKLMVDMDKQHNGHVWTRTSTSHIKNDMDLMFRSASCEGHFCCDNQNCKYLSCVYPTSLVNELEWDGFTTTSFQVGCQPPSQSSIICKICKTPPACVATCEARIYYVFDKDHMTCACVHLGVHEHPVKNRKYQDFKDRSCTLLGEQVERTPHATNSSLVMEATKELVGELLLKPEGAPTKTFTFEELVPVLDKCKYMSSPSIKNDVTSFRYIRRYGVMDAVTMLRDCSNWLYVQENLFPGQGSDFDKIFVFKISEVGPGSDINLVKRM